MYREWLVTYKINNELQHRHLQTFEVDGNLSKEMAKERLTNMNKPRYGDNVRVEVLSIKPSN